MFKRSIAALALAALVFAASSRAQSTPQPQWVGTWATSPMQADGGSISVSFPASLCARSFTSLPAAIRFACALPTSSASIPSPSADAHVALSAGGGRHPARQRSRRHLWRRRVGQHSSRRRHLLRSRRARRRAARRSRRQLLSASADHARRNLPRVRRPGQLRRRGPVARRADACRRPRRSPRGTSLTASMSQLRPAPAPSSPSATPSPMACTPRPTPITAGPTCWPRVSARTECGPIRAQ